MDSSDGPVRLARSPPAEPYAGQLVFYDAIPEQVISRSSVLSVIVASDGDVTLPGVVTLHDFEAWTKVDCSTTKQPDFIDIAHACSVLQVADALGDACLAGMCKSAARILRQNALTHSETGKADPQDTSHALSRLPVQLQRCLFEAVMTAGNTSYLGLLLDFLPSEHHTTLVETAITQQKALTLPPNTDVSSATQALLQIPASPPPLLSLSICNDLPAPKEHSSSNPSQQATAAITAALCHHSSLTSLSLTRLPTEIAFAQALAPLSCLKALHLSSMHAMAGDDFPLFKTAVLALRALEDLSFSVAGQQEHQHCLASLLSSLTALTSLEIEEVGIRQCFSASAPINLPRLNHLRLKSDTLRLAIVLLQQLCGPLTSISLADTFAHWHMADVLRVERLWPTLVEFSQLRTIALDLDLVSRSNHVREALWRHCLPLFQQSIRPLFCLRELRIVSHLRTLISLLPQRHLPRADVRHLALCARTDTINALPRESEILWATALTVVNNYNLRHLDLQIRRGDAQPLPGGISYGSLMRLTQLTALHMRNWMGCLAEEEDCEALAGMQQLQSLCVEQFTMPPAVLPAFVRVAGALPHLTTLMLQPADSAAAFGAAFAHDAPGAAWPALRALALPAASDAEAGALLAAVPAFPALQQLTLGSERHPPSVSEAAREGLGRAAAEAGVSLSFDESWAQVTGRVWC